MATIREWRNEEWETGSKARDQHELQFMAKKILAGADIITNKPTPGHSRDDLSRVIEARSSWLPNVRYIIHMNGFTVEDINETTWSDEELKRIAEAERKLALMKAEAEIAE